STGHLRRARIELSVRHALAGKGDREAIGRQARLMLEHARQIQGGRMMWNHSALGALIFGVRCSNPVILESLITNRSIVESEHTRFRDSAIHGFSDSGISDSGISDQ